MEWTCLVASRRLEFGIYFWIFALKTHFCYMFEFLICDSFAPFFFFSHSELCILVLVHCSEKKNSLHKSGESDFDRIGSDMSVTPGLHSQESALAQEVINLSS